MLMDTGRYFKKTWKTKLMLWIHRNWPRVDQWVFDWCDYIDNKKRVKFKEESYRSPAQYEDRHIKDPKEISFFYGHKDG